MINRTIMKVWDLSLIKLILSHRYIMRRTGFKIKFVDSSTQLFNFPNYDHEEFINELLKLR